MEKKFITTRQASEIAGVTVNTIQNLCKSGVIRYAKRSHLYAPLLEDVERYANSIQEIHEISTSIEDYKKQLIDEKKTLECEVYRIKEQNHFQLVNMKLYPKRLEVLKDVLMAILECFGHYSDYSDTAFTRKDIDLLQEVAKGTSFEQVGGGLSAERVRQKYKLALYRLASGRSVLRHLIDENNDLKKELQAKNIETCSPKEQVKEEARIQELNEETKKMSKILAIKVCDLGLPPMGRVMNLFHVAEMKTLRDVVRMPRSEFLKYRNFGKKSLAELDEVIEKYGLHYHMNVDKYPEYIDLNE